MPHLPKKEAIRRFTTIIRKSSTELVAVSDVLPALNSMGIRWRLRCGAQQLRSDGRLLVLTTSDPCPVISVHRSDWNPKKGDLLEERQQAGPETWEYPLPPKCRVVGEYYLQLSWEGRVQRVRMVNPISTLVNGCGWGQEIEGEETDAALESTDIVWAVAQLLTEDVIPDPSARDLFERLRAIGILEALSGSQPQAGR